MNSDTKLILESWEAVKDSIPAARREDAVHKLLKVFEEYGIDIDAGELQGEDPHLDSALESYQDHSDNDDDHDED